MNSDDGMVPDPDRESGFWLCLMALVEILIALGAAWVVISGMISWD